MAFCGYLKQSTAVDILLGPFMDDGDGDTPDTDATIDVELSKNGQALADSESAAPTHDAAGDVDGYYNCVLGTTDTNTLGILTVVAHHADDLPVRQDYQVVTANWFDTMCSTEKLDVNVGEISDDSTAANNLELQYDGTGLIGDNYPFTQSEGAALGGGLSILTTMASATAILGDSNNLSNANTSDDSRWTADDNGGGAPGAETIFRCTPADTADIPVELTFEGYYDEPGGTTNGATLQVYNFSSAGWDTIVMLTNASSDEDHEVPLSHAHKAPGTGTLETVGYTIGDVMIKFKQDTAETGDNCLLIDYMVVGFVGSLVTAEEVVDEWEGQSQSDPTGFHVNVKEVNGTGQTANDNAADINTLITQVGTAGDGLTAINLPNQTMDIIGNITGNLSGSVGSCTAGVTLGADAITAAKIADDAFSAEHFATNCLTNDALDATWVTEIWAKAMVDLAAGAPSATASVLVAINWLYEAWRNKTITNGTNSEIEVYKDDGSTKLCEADISDDGTDFTKGKYGAAD